MIATQLFCLCNVSAECLPPLSLFTFSSLLFCFVYFIFHNFLNSLVSLCLSSEIAGMGRVESVHVTLFSSVTFVFYLAIRSFPTLGLTVIRETS